MKKIEQGDLMAKSTTVNEQCPFSISMNIMSGKWKMTILWHLSKGTVRFNEMQRLLPRITQKTLTQQLRELESDGLVKRNIYAEVPPRVEYCLTELGESIRPVLDCLCRWGKQYRENFKEA
jgi:DNA-binding HxlR family transcriptional regulator